MIGGKARAITLEMPAPPAQADDDDDAPPARPIGRINLNTAVVERENFDNWLFGDVLPEEIRQRRLKDILERMIEVATWRHKLNDRQRAKLRLAGRGDIKRFFDVVEDRRRDFETERQSFGTGRAALIRLDPLARLYRDGPFGDGSLFAKTLRRINDDRKAGDVVAGTRRSAVVVPRMTARRWLIAVAVVALACAATVRIRERRSRFARIAQEHSGAWPPLAYPDLVVATEAERERLTLWSARVTAWHAGMAGKYQRAARYPWLPVEPDPPEPPRPE
jgi:hypothetical protein